MQPIGTITSTPNSIISLSFLEEMAHLYAIKFQIITYPLFIIGNDFRKLGFEVYEILGREHRTNKLS